ncbi:MAG: SMC-Scp complex subunit ScpB [Actinomycetota bacterium]|nr:SMC-Scp complex subunit ScpB [Actinomycetota bacterium]
MTPSERKIVESILLVADEPVPAGMMAEVLERSAAEVHALLEDLSAEYSLQERGFVLRESAAGWRLYTSPDTTPWLERFVLGHRRGRLSGAALEVLAVVAYKQPVSRAEIAEIRGVDSDRVVRTLLQRNLISESARDLGPGAPSLFTVSDEFLERMGLRSVDELPPLVGFMPTTEAVEEMESRLSPGA